MGSATVSNAKPTAMETTDKKTLLSFIKSIPGHLFPKKKEKNKCDKKANVAQTQETNFDVKPVQNSKTVEAILENFVKLNLEDSKPLKQVKLENEDDEIKNFTIKVIVTPRSERTHSHSSGDSGFSDTKEAENADKTEKYNKLEKNEESDDLAEGLEKLGLDDDKKKKKKMQTALVSRGPIRTKVGAYSVGPYSAQEQDNNYRQISQINKHTLTGGQVLVNQCQVPDSFSEIDIALESVQKKSQFLQNDRETYLEDVMELISEDTNKICVEIPTFSPEYECQVQLATNIDYVTENKSIQNTFATDYEEKSVLHDDLMKLLAANFEVPPEQPNGIEEFNPIFSDVQQEYRNTSRDGFINSGTYPTPPSSETVPSPMSASPASIYPSNSEYTLSPGRSPIYNNDYEKYQEIPHFEEEKDATDKKSRERNASVSSMTMKQFKDMQKEISYKFSKRDCCLMTRKSCKELFQGHLQKIKMPEVRKNLCVEIAKLDLKDIYGVLKIILLNLSKSSDKEDILSAAFGMICDRLLGQDPALFIGDAGLSLLMAAALRCPHRPLMTRYLVQCIRTVLSTDPSLIAGRDYIFHEVDPLGDNLVIACAREGDNCSEVLSEIVRPYDDQPPLFKMHHTNADGQTALHVACSKHSASSPRLHTVHVLLVHAGFDITDGDLKGGDTALHLAVNSANCDLQLILMMFKQVERKDWKSLAHCPNLSTKTPLDLARLATKTATRQHYPQEVLDFLKKCR